jgi:hypothetical protein
MTTSLRQHLFTLTLAVLVTTGMLGGVDQLARPIDASVTPANWAASPAAPTAVRPAA